jgi:hypothetical protein
LFRFGHSRQNQETSDLSGLDGQIAARITPLKVRDRTTRHFTVESYGFTSFCLKINGRYRDVRFGADIRPLLSLNEEDSTQRVSSGGITRVTEIFRFITFSRRRDSENSIQKGCARIQYIVSAARPSKLWGRVSLCCATELYLISNIDLLIVRFNSNARNCRMVTGLDYKSSMVLCHTLQVRTGAYVNPTVFWPYIRYSQYSTRF